jgi:hypothetical protein
MHEDTKTLKSNLITTFDFILQWPFLKIARNFNSF